MSKKTPKAIYIGELKIGDIKLPCAVLEDMETRIISSAGFLKALKRPWRGKYKRTEMPNFLAANNLKPFIPRELMDLLAPIEYITPSGGGKRSGYRAELLPMVCDVYLKARDTGTIGQNAKQWKTVIASDIVMRALAHVGIIALVDEATGFQEIRDRHGLEKILERWISKELVPWTKTFPDEFYQRIFEFNGWPYDPTSVKRPRLIGKWTNDFIYERLETGVLDRLREKTPRDSRGRLKDKLFQSLTHDFGYIKLREHLAGVIALMRIAPNWARFKSMMNRAYPRKGVTLELPFEEE